VRIVFMGTPSFAVPSLQSVAARHEVTLVLTRPDAASGRGAAVRPSPVKQAALELDLPVAEPTSLRGDAEELIRSHGPDVICVAAFGMLLPPAVLALPKFGCMNVHASLLPRYRGAAPVQRAILDGATETGVSIMRMEEGLDTGPYALQRRIAIDGKYAADVEDELARVGAEALVTVLDQIGTRDVAWVSQDESLATYAAKVTKDDLALLPELTVAEAFARVRAATRRAPARACVGDRELTVVRATPVPARSDAGGVCLYEGRPVLGFADGALALEVVRPAGKADMPAAEWARGARLSADTCWRCTR
jgi:methionyl-tRNA formyltransferase